MTKNSMTKKTPKNSMTKAQQEHLALLKSTTVSDTQKEYLNVLVAHLEKVQGSRDCLTPEGANNVLRAIKNVQGRQSEDEYLDVASILSVFYQVITLGQTRGCFTLQDVEVYYPPFKLLEEDLKKIERENLLKKDQQDDGPRVVLKKEEPAIEESTSVEEDVVEESSETIDSDIEEKIKELSEKELEILDLEKKLNDLKNLNK